ncbi:bifunctional 4-hydroxy-2-oxoglutarate aldolase/2-dehydro-3-deoxy-phosphogluconate aldolase [Microbacteriaceae bacterium VKM Ac-2854]|nr:bifunctional 4-hydroxy-2-oxoglutarate aldolase/2-dehydro-3-deoxy-phosphogluconate aldolase [Microbacteriaceae bacterium VKM Ac-2854]
MSVRDRLAASRIVPVVVIDDAAHARGIVDALSSGGIGSAEITLRTSAGLEALAAAAEHPTAVVGAGTVLSAEQVDRCVDAGAQFIVSPGLDVAVVERALEHGILPLPGIATASELQLALSLGLTAVKLFPVELLGGVRAVDALAAPFPDVEFFPSGGVSAANAGEYLRRSSVLAVGGSWMVPRDALARGDTDTVRRLSTDTVRALDEATS